MSISSKTFALLIAVVAFAGLPAGAPRAEGGIVPLVPNLPNNAGGGLGIINEYPGSDDFIVGALPVAMVSLKGKRYLQLLATYLSANLVDDPHFRFGPVANYRFGRKDVDDPVVAQVHEVDGAVELGASAGGEWIFDNDIRHRAYAGVDLTFDVTGSYGGYFLDLYARYWLPVSRAVDIGLGVSTNFGGNSYMNEFFGVTPDDSARSELPAFNADAGLQAIEITPMVMVHLSEAWHAGIGGRYSRLMSDAANSPIVRQRGSADQFVAGVGLGYAW